MKTTKLEAPAARAVARALAAALWLALCFACGTTRQDAGRASHPEPPPPVPGPWTEEFLRPAVLIADVVEIEGPQGLIAHVATRPIQGEHERVERTLAEGFEQEIKVTAPTSSEIKVWLDQLDITAMRRVRILERVGGGPVVVRASGDAFWRATGSPEERRGPRIELRGDVPKTP